jgi:hypothetical protein
MLIWAWKSYAHESATWFHFHNKHGDALSSPKKLWCLNQAPFVFKLEKYFRSKEINAKHDY